MINGDSAGNQTVAIIDIPEIASIPTITSEDLEQALDAARDRLDRNTVRVVEQSLATIDRAILDAYDALEQDPTNSYLSSHLAATMKRKVELLQRVVTIANAASS